jgi:hypothetical protein
MMRKFLSQVVWVEEEVEVVSQYCLQVVSSILNAIKAIAWYCEHRGSSLHEYDFEKCKPSQVSEVTNYRTYSKSKLFQVYGGL